MINNGLTFGTQGPVMSGTWYNPKTGDSFTVMDSFFENNQYMVKTTDGRVLEYNLLQNYVQSDTPIPPMNKNNVVNELPASVLSELATDDFVPTLPREALGMTTPTNLGNINTPAVESNKGIIGKALGKCSKPEVVANIIWDDFPKRQIEMLSEIMEIDVKEIVEWYTNQLDTTEIAIAIHNSIVRYINDQLYGKVEEMSGFVSVDNASSGTTSYAQTNTTIDDTRTSTTIDDTPKTPKKATPKKTTKKTKKS